VERKATAARSGRLDGCLRCCVWLGAVLWCIALSAPLEARADAEPFEVPLDRALEPALPEFTSCPGLPTVPEAYEPFEPESPEELPDDYDSSARQLTLLREEAAQICRAETERQEALLRRTWWVVSQLLGQQKEAHETNEYLGADLEASAERKGQLESVVEALNGPLTVEGSSGGGVSEVEVVNPPDVAGVETAVLTSAETGNQNMWGILGLVVGFGFLAGIYKLVRP